MFSAIRTALGNAIKSPFRSYFKVGSVGFGGTFLGNIAWTSVDENAPLSITQNPEMYSACLLAKSAFAGFLWPAIPFRIYNNPRKFFCVGGGLQESTYEVFNGDHSLDSIEDLDSLAKGIHTTGMEGLQDYLRKGIQNGTIRVKVNGNDAKDDCLKRLETPKE
jgi:hypothetical protein